MYVVYVVICELYVLYITTKDLTNYILLPRILKRKLLCLGSKFTEV